MAISSGGLGIQRVYVGDTALAGVYLGSSKLWAPASYDTSNVGVQANSYGPTFPYTASAGADVFVAVSIDRAPSSFTGVTYGGVAMELVSAVHHDGASQYGTLRLYRLRGAGTGAAKTVAVQMVGNLLLAVSAISFHNTPSTLSPSTATGFSTAATQTVSLVGPVGLYVASAGGAGSPTWPFNSFSGVTNRTNRNANGTQLTLSTVASSGTVTATSAGSDHWASIFVPF
ncbi:hypothetical protein [Mycobacterium phage BK1]|nr:hypothetical protein [Mycobacterium phage BK1]